MKVIEQNMMIMLLCGGVTPTVPSVEGFVNPRTESISRHGSPIQKDNAKERAVSPGSLSNNWRGCCCVYRHD